MSSWPRTIQPEDRIKYLIEARHDFKDSAEWSREVDGALICVTKQEEYLHVEPADNGFEAWYSMLEHDDEFLVGEFDKAMEAKKAVIDHTVVVWAMRQAWEDLAT